VHPWLEGQACAVAQALVCQRPSLSGTCQMPVNGRPTRARDVPVLSPDNAESVPALVSRYGARRWLGASVAGSARISGETPGTWPRGSGFALYPVTGLVRRRALPDGWGSM
jgi:hypothetical protein